MERFSCVNCKHFRRAMAVGVLCGILTAGGPGRAQNGATGVRSGRVDSVVGLAREVGGKGWIVYSAQSGAGDWDLFVMRPDGTDRRQIIATKDFSEAAARFSPDGKRLLYYRMPKTETLDNNKYGTHELVISKADGTEPVVCGESFSWASWSPDGTQIACLSRQGIQFIDLATRGIVRKLERKGIVEQLFWSPDGRWLVGTANGLGEHWAIGRIDALTGELNRVSDGNCFNCTPDWFPDSRRVVYSKGHPLTEGWAQLWMAEGNGEGKRMLYGEIGRHIYGGSISPDGRYVLFTRSREDLGKVDNSYTEMALIRLEDTPIVGGKSEALQGQYPKAKSGPVLELSGGWEPHWTAAQLRFPQ
jgi:Tol biopolymer transport system component